MVQVVIYPNMESYIHLSKNRAALLSKYGYYLTAQNFNGENIDEFDEFPAIRQYFPYQNFPFS